MGTRLHVKSVEDYRAWVTEKSTEWQELNEDEDRPAWYGIEGKFWWWWDSNEVRVGYAEDYLK